MKVSIITGNINQSLLFLLRSAFTHISFASAISFPKSTSKSSFVTDKPLFLEQLVFGRAFFLMENLIIGIAEQKMFIFC